MAQRELLKWPIVVNKTQNKKKKNKRSDGSECERAIAEVDRKLTKRKVRHKKTETQDCYEKVAVAAFNSRQTTLLHVV